MEKRKKITDQVITYKELKAAAGGTSGGGGSSFMAGQKVDCEILQVEPGGYLVKLEKCHLRGFLATDMEYEPGEYLSVHYICVHNDRILLSLSSGAATN